MRADLIASLPDLLEPDVIAHLPPSFNVSEQNLVAWIAERSLEADVFLIKDGVSLNLIGLMFLTRPINADVHLGYLLGKSVWGKGIATELLTGLLEHLSKTNLRLLAGVGVDNPESANLLEKVGFVKIDQDSDLDTMMYSITLT